jgi:hypothetical protein
LPDGPLLCNCGHRSRFAKEHPLPLINPYGDVSDDEALLTYGENLETTLQLAAARSTPFQLTVNLKIARHLGVTILATVLVRADRVLE